MQPPRPTPNPAIQALNHALRTGDWPTAEAILLKVTKKERRNPEPHFHLGMVLRRQGREKEAVRAFERALKIDPKLPQVQFERGQALFALDELKEARRAFETALKLAPGDVGCRAHLALIARLQGRYGEAVAGYDALLTVAGLDANQDVMLRLGLVEALRDAGEFDRMGAEASTLAARQPAVRPSLISILSQGKRSRLPLKPSAI